MRTVKTLAATGSLAALILGVSALPAQAQASPSASSGAARQPYRVIHVFEYPSFSILGDSTWFYGNDDQCTYVGADWNDNIRSARTESPYRVELWEHANCTGYAIVVDRTGYGNIGPWVSAFRPIG